MVGGNHRILFFCCELEPACEALFFACVVRRQERRRLVRTCSGNQLRAGVRRSVFRGDDALPL